MRQLTVRGLVRLPLAVGALAVVGWPGLVAEVHGEPRYWAGDVSFVTQATYVEATPAASQPMSSPQRSDVPEPVIATSEAVDSDGGSLHKADSAIARPRPQRSEPSTPVVEPPPVAQPRQPTSRYHGRFARPTPAELPRRMQVQLSAPRPAAPRNRPFESAAGRPTISPYLNLFREETESQVVPDYFTYVRPQLEQQEANRRQQQELEQLERRIPGGPAAVGTPSAGADSAGRRPPARFMDTAQFYSGWQR